MKYFFAVSSPLFDEAGDGNTGGGGAGAGSPGAFDQAAFKAELMGEINKTINGSLKTLKADFAKLVTPPKTDPPAQQDPPAADAKDGKAVDPEKNALMLELKTLKTSFTDKFKQLEEQKAAADKKADEAERDSLIRSELGKYSFAPGKAAETAFALVKAAVTRAEDGTLVANDLPLGKYIETELPTNHAYLLAARDIGSAGGRPGNKTPGGGKQFSEADLEPAVFDKKSPAEKAAIRQWVRTSLGY